MIVSPGGGLTPLRSQYLSREPLRLVSHLLLVARLLTQHKKAR